MAAPEPLQHKPEDKREPELPWYLFWIRKEWPKLMRASPLGIAKVAIACVFISGGIVWLAVTVFILPGKDATIQAKDATIEKKEATIQQLTAEKDRFKSELEMAGVSSTPLKKRSLILSQQISEFAQQWPTNADERIFQDRFQNRLERIRNELDEHGQRSPEFDSIIKYGDLNSSIYNQPNLYRMSAILKKLAENLKE